jgi:hypothetical protein
MNKVIFLLLSLFSLTVTQAQINELGVFVGGSNYIGDIGPTTYITPNSPAIGILYKWNRSLRHSWRFSYTQSKITSKDVDSEEINRKQRGYSFENNIKELSAGIEFNFFDFDLNTLKRSITPYVFTGLNLSFYDGLFFNNNQAKFDSKQKTLALPIILGVKSNLTSNFVLGLEVGARYTFAEDLDGSFSKNENLKSYSFGNLNNNDWYVFSGLTLTYTFGIKPCFCAE